MRARPVTWNAAADEQRFRDDMALGHQWVLWAAEQLRNHQLPVTVPDLQCRPDFGDRAAFRDAGDLFVGPVRVEVRSLGIPFKGPASYPYRTIRVELATVAHSKRNAGLFLFVSRPSRCMMGLPPGGRLQLEPQVWNERRKVARDWLVADRGRLIGFQQVIQYLHERASE
jgi:hypothetical protein